MKNLIKIVVLLGFTASLTYGQPVFTAPDPPEAIGINELQEGIWGVASSKMSQEDEEKYLEKLSAEIKKQLLEIKQLDEKKYYSLLRKSSSLRGFYSISDFSGVSIINENKEQNQLRKKIREMEIASEALGIKHQHAKSQDDKNKIESQLQTTLSQIFDLRETQRMEEVEKLEQKLAELKESMNLRNSNKQAIIEERLRTLIGKDRYLRWD